tara:strand:+ start:106 stop:516 length:411 start_codon:yes stop_codon:yes gene_type:complete
MNGEKNHFVFKMISGEEIVAVTEIDDTGVEPVFFLQNPLKVELTHKGNHTMVRLIPWITIPEDEIFKIGFDKIITMTQLQEDHEMIQAYEHYNDQRKLKGTHKVKLSERMGYMGNVNDARVALEKIFVSTGITTTV